MNLQKKLQNMGIEQIDKIDPEFVSFSCNIQSI